VVEVEHAEPDLDGEMSALLAEAVAEPQRAARIFEVLRLVHGPEAVVAALQRVNPPRAERLAARRLSR